MKNLPLIYGSLLLFVACTKEVQTKIVSEPNVSTVVTSNPSPVTTLEGTINGGGGKGVLCVRNGIETVQTLDLYEAETLYNLPTFKKAQSKEEAIELTASLFSRHYWNVSTIPLEEITALNKKGIEKMVDGLRFVGATQKLKLTNDSFEPIIDSSCKVIQVAILYNESTLLVDPNYWNKMDWTQRSSLLLHEILYGQDRSNGATNSLNTRKLVAQMFSKKGARPKGDGVPPDRKKHATCHVNERGFSVAYLYAYNSESDRQSYDDRSGVEFVFNYLFKNNSIFRTSAFFYGLKIQDIFKEKTDVIYHSPIIFDSEVSQNRAMTIRLAGNGEGKVLIRDGNTGEVSQELDLRCDRMTD